MSDDTEAGPANMAQAHKQQIETLRRALSLALTGEPDTPLSLLPEDAEEFHRSVRTREAVLPENGDPDGKRENILSLAVTRWKENQRRPQGITLKYDDVQAAANCAKSHAYTLMADMGEEYDGIKYDTGGETPHRLIFDTELLYQIDELERQVQ